MFDATSLTAIVRTRLQQGFVIDDRMALYAETFWGMQSAAALRVSLDSEELFNSGLAELLFLAEADLLYAIEETLPIDGLSPAVLESVEQQLIASLTSIPLNVAAEGDAIALTAVADVVRLFLQGLNLSNPVILPGDLDAPKELMMQIRARLRQQTRSFAPEEQLYIERLLKQFCAAAFLDEALLLRALDYSLTLIFDRVPGSDIYQRFCVQKNNLQKELAAAEDFRAMYGSRYSMDYLMMSGVKVPTLDEAAARDEIFLIDKICVTVFGRGAQGLEPIQHSRVGVKDKDDAAVASVLKHLS